MSGIELDEAQRRIVRGIVADILEVDEDEIGETDNFRDSFGADSMGALEMLAALERRFDCLIPQEHLARMTNLQGVFETLAEALATV